MPKIVKLAYHVPTGKIAHIDRASRGLACECICLACKEELQAVKGEQREHHFRHNNNENCGGDLETVLHQLAKQILVDNTQISIPKYGNIGYKNAISEETFESIKPDVTASLLNDEPVCFEVFHTHAMGFAKEQFFKLKKLKCVEINMKNCPIDKYDSIKDFVLNETKDKRVIFWESQPEKGVEQEDNTWLYLVGGLIGSAVTVAVIFPKLGRKIWNSIFS